MAIQDKLPTRANPSPAQSSDQATRQPSSQAARGDHVEARETSTDHANKEIAKPEFDIVQDDARAPR